VPDPGYVPVTKSIARPITAIVAAYLGGQVRGSVGGVERHGSSVGEHTGT
jgi:hypothetical protein